MKNTPINCSRLAIEILSRISESKQSSVQEAERCKILLMLSDGLSPFAIGVTTPYSAGKARRWRRRWKSYGEAFSKIEGREETGGIARDLGKKIRECIRDAPRPGSPGKFTAEQYCQMLGVALEAPELSGRPIGQWGLTELVDEVQKRGIVESISRAQLCVFLKGKRG